MNSDGAELWEGRDAVRPRRPAAPSPKPDGDPDPLQKTSEAAAHRTLPGAPFPAWSLPHASALQPGARGTANPRSNGGLGTHRVPGVGHPRAARGPEVHRSQWETSQHCVGTPGTWAGWNYNSQEPPRRGASGERPGTSCHGGCGGEGVAAGVAPWTVDGGSPGGPAGCPETHPFLHGCWAAVAPAASRQICPEPRAIWGRGGLPQPSQVQPGPGRRPHPRKAAACRGFSYKQAAYPSVLVIIPQRGIIRPISQMRNQRRPFSLYLL